MGTRQKHLTKKGTAQGTGSIKSILNVSKLHVAITWEATKTGVFHNFFVSSAVSYMLQPVSHYSCQSEFAIRCVFPVGSVQWGRCAFLLHPGPPAAMLPQEPQTRLILRSRQPPVKRKSFSEQETTLYVLPKTKEWTYTTKTTKTHHPILLHEMLWFCLLQHEDSRCTLKINIFQTAEVIKPYFI